MTFLVRQNEFLVRQKDRAYNNMYFIKASNIMYIMYKEIYIIFIYGNTSFRTHITWDYNARK
jgi:hypothetical protein